MIGFMIYILCGLILGSIVAIHQAKENENFFYIGSIFLCITLFYPIAVFAIFIFTVCDSLRKVFELFGR